MSNTQNTDSGCFSAIMRRILCAGSLQTHPSDPIVESNPCKFDHANKDSKRDARILAPEPKRVVDTPALAPGVVARLMGLDSLPDSKWVPRERLPDSVTRSRSVNFMDYLLELDLGQSRHRRVRTSVSFREVPTSFQGVQQNQDFLVLYLGTVEETEEVGLRKEGKRDEEKRKNKENMRERVMMKKKKKENQVNNAKISALKNEPRRSFSNKHFPKHEKEINCRKLSGKRISKERSPVKSVYQKEKYMDSKKMLKKKKKKKENQAVECSSSASVVDHNFLSSIDEYLLLEMKPIDSIPKKKRPPTAANYDSPSPHPTQVLNTDHQQEAEYYGELMSELCRLIKEDLEESNWTAKKGFAFEGFEETCKELGQQILDQLVHHIVCELVLFYM
ncbi:hypothetical protein HS088_TW13G00124 [Tripterygium wilfordii]|uniref:DUF3741 domain-containing protein n=1 Tax=Tripterygium wilfordii TaxID=458696 RepID=A0A7J7CT05_TRIWF|nr:uncharacterized protein LOC120012034 [Tripterygium wilfordii]KAF5737245.1 hypothetical protein HS088_TW13G00124 [Tripterygium wilfordii]